MKRDIWLWSIEWDNEDNHGNTVNGRDVIVLAGPTPESAIAKWRKSLKAQGSPLPSKFTIESTGEVDIF